jgi:Animal haem peroxidase
MSAKHSTPVRGLLRGGEPPAAPQSFQGRFGKMFPKVPEARFGKSAQEETANLTKLANAMVAEFDTPKDGPDDEESGIPALYTYFGQFIDHDLTFDPDGSFQKQKDPDALTDFRTPAFDLDNVYGRGPGDQPYMYNADGKSFALGDPLLLGDAGARDLLRSPAGRALIGDPRNDENAIVSQLQGLFLRFHNRLVQDNPKLAFEDVQQLLRLHYQHVVVHDFLPRIVGNDVLAALRNSEGKYDRSKLKFFDTQNVIMPVEFSGAAYRLGHSMVRPGYRLNDATLLPIFPVAPEKQPGLPEGLTGFRRMISDWAIDWGRFIDIDVRKYHVDPKSDNGLADFKRLQFAYRIDTSLVNPLAGLPMSVASNPPPSLILRNLERGVQLHLPSGQAVAKAMELTPLADDKILIGQALDKKPTLTPITQLGSVFAGNCPLWTYVLAEAMQHKKALAVPVQENATKPASVTVGTPQLGPVGGRIVAEVFLGLLFGDPHSLLGAAKVNWTPPSSGFALKDFVKYALGH